MRNAFSAATLLFVSILLTGRVFAAVPNISVRLSQPKSPTNLTDLTLTVVTLDRLDRSVTVKCFKKGPSDGGFIQFGSDIVITNSGGNSVNCVTNSGILSSSGTYQFQATAQADADSETSPIVSVDFNNSTGPGAVQEYAKNRVNTCDYHITFKTADDGGKTVSVEVYRSEFTSFSANAGSRVDTLSIGSNTQGSSTTTPPQCDKDYYYAVRAFDAFGNGSGLVGDSVTHTTTTTITTASGTTGATSGPVQSAVAAGTAGNILGVETGPTGYTEEQVRGEVLGQAKPQPEEAFVSPIQQEPESFQTKTAALTVFTLLVLIIAIILRRRKNTPVV